MDVLLTGATGYIGSAVLRALVAADYSVTALVRSDSKAAVVNALGARPVVGDIAHRDTVERLAADADAVIATASPGDATSGAVENAFADAVLNSLGAGNAFVRTGGAWVYGSAAGITEESAIDAPALVSWRPELDARVLEASAVRSVLVEPGVVYGRRGGMANLVVGAERVGAPLALRLVGPGTQHWTTVHVDDLAALYVAVLAKAEGGMRFLGVSGDNPTTRELGEAASRRIGLHGRVAAEEPSILLQRLGLLGEALLLDQQASPDKAQRELGWLPTRPSLVDEILAGGYDPL